MTAGRAAIVTGGSRGIGLAIGRVLAEHGMAITICGRGERALEEARAALAAAGASAVQTVPGDLRDPDLPGEVVARHRDAFGRLDVMVNNVGVGTPKGVGGSDEGWLQLHLDLNLATTVRFYREAAGLLAAAGAEHRGALVLNTASMAAKRPQPYLSAYSATKAAVVAFTAAMNRELNERGVKSTALCPGLVDTEMTSWIHDQVSADSMLSGEDIAGAVRWLLSTSSSCVVPEIPFTRLGDVP